MVLIAFLLQQWLHEHTTLLLICTVPVLLHNRAIGLCPTKCCTHLSSTSLIHVLRTIITNARYIFISFFYGGKILIFRRRRNNFTRQVIQYFKNARQDNEGESVKCKYYFHCQFWKGGGEGKKIAENLNLRHEWN